MDRKPSRRRDRRALERQTKKRDRQHLAAINRAASRIHDQEKSDITLAATLKGIFLVARNEELQRWEFTPNFQIAHIRIPFSEATTEEEAWNAVYQVIRGTPVN